MKKAILALATAVTIGVTALAVPSPAEARWRGGGWGPGIAGGLIGAAVIGGLASSAYAYGPGYGAIQVTVTTAATRPRIMGGTPPRITVATQLATTPQRIMARDTGASCVPLMHITAAPSTIVGIIADIVTTGDCRDEGANATASSLALVICISPSCRLAHCPQAASA
jgi:hypothetical protein